MRNVTPDCNVHFEQVNVGDLLEVYTNGAYPATRHRVVIPEEEVVRRQPRQSFVLFLQPDAERVAKPIKGYMSHSYMMYALSLTLLRNLRE